MADGWETISGGNDGWEDVAPTPQKTSLLEDFKLGLANVGNMADKGWTLAASTIAPKSEQDAMFRNMEDRIASRKQFADVGNKEQGFGGKVATVASTLPMQLVAAPLSAIDTATEMINNGDSLDAAYKAAGVDAAFTAAGFAVPAGIGKTLLQKVLSGAGANAIQDFLSKYIISNKIAETKGSKKQFAPSAEDAAVAGLMGGAFGATVPRKAVTPERVAARPDINPETEPVRPVKSADGWEDVGTTAHADDYASFNPYDVAGRVSELEAGRPFEVDQPQGNLFGGAEEGSLRQPRIEDVNPDALLNEQHRGNQMEFDGPGLRLEEQTQGGVRNIDPETGRVVQGMDESVPTIDFPLRTEVLDADPAVNAMREQVQAHEAQLAHLKESGADLNSIVRVEQQIDAVKNKFGEYMDQGYGIEKPKDAYTPLIESGGELALPIRSTYTPTFGKFGKQKGAINPKDIREGINILKERFSKIGIGGRVADIAAKQAGEAEAKPTIYNDEARALLDSRAGKGLADLTMLDLNPEKVIEAAKSFDDVQRAPIQENIENGGLFRTMATKNPVVKFTTERLIRANQAAARVIKDNLTDPKTGLKSTMRKMSPTEKGDIWAIQMLAEGQRVFTPEELSARGFNEKQIQYYNRYREIDDSFYKDFNAERERLGLAPMDKRTGHIAGRFAGDFYSVATKLNADGTKEIIGRIGGRTKWEYQKAVEFMKARHPDWEIGRPEYNKLGRGNTAGARFNGFMEAVNLVGKEDGNVAQLVEAYREMLKSDAEKYLNAGRHAKDKKAAAGGIEGSEGNKAWQDVETNAENGMKAQLDYFEQGYQWLEMQRAADDVKEVLGNKEIIERMPNAVGWASSHLDHVMGKGGGVLADATNELVSALGKASGLGHTNLLKGSNAAKHFMMQKFMGFMNIPFTMAQLVQPLQSIPSMSLLMKNRGVEFSGLQAGIDSTSSMMKRTLGNAFGNDPKLSAFEKAAFDYADKYEVFDVKMVDHTRDINVSKGKEAFDAFADANIKYPEMFTRGTAFMFYAHALKQTGMPLKDVFTTAENMTRMTMVDYTPSARPQMYDKMGFVGDMASTLARYKHGQLNNMMAYGREVGKGKGGLSSVAPIASFFAAQVAFGGLMGVTGYSAADWLVRKISGNFFKDPTSLTDMIISSKSIPEWISHGSFAAAGVDMSSRFSNAEIVPESVGEFLMPYGTGLWEMVEAGYGFGKNPNEFNAKRLAHAVAPSSLRGFAENQMFSEKDQASGKTKTINPRTMEGGYSRNDAEVGMRNFGFRSMSESKTAARLFEQKQKDMVRQEQRNSIMDKTISNLLSGAGGTNALKDAAKDYAKLGSTQFDTDLTNRVKAMNLTPEQRYMLGAASGNFAGAFKLKEYLREGNK